MIKLRDILESAFNKKELDECWEDLGSMKSGVQLVDIYYDIQRGKNGDIYAYPLDQTRLFKAVNKFGYVAVVGPLLSKINNNYGPTDGYYVLGSNVYEPTKPVVFVYTPKQVTTQASLR